MEQARHPEKNQDVKGYIQLEIEMFLVKEALTVTFIEKSTQDPCRFPGDGDVRKHKKLV